MHQCVLCCINMWTECIPPAPLFNILPPKLTQHICTHLFIWQKTLKRDYFVSYADSQPISEPVSKAVSQAGLAACS